MYKKFIIAICCNGNRQNNQSLKFQIQQHFDVSTEKKKIQLHCLP